MARPENPDRNGRLYSYEDYIKEFVPEGRRDQLLKEPEGNRDSSRNEGGIAIITESEVKIIRH
jgi:hypothetical protein